MTRDLRNLNLDGWKFVRQAPIESYFVDFLCRAHKVVVEVDGGTHGTEAEIAYDERRSRLAPRTAKSQGRRCHTLSGIVCLRQLRTRTPIS